MENPKLKSKSLVLFRQACLSAVNDNGALQLGNLHVELGEAGGLQFACAEGLGSRLVPGVRFRLAAPLGISRNAQILARSWGSSPQFPGQTAAASKALVGAGLLDCLLKLEAAYVEIHELLLRVPDVSQVGSVLQINELFLTEDGDTFAQVEFGPRRNRDEAFAFLGDLDRCMHHQVGWRPSLLGFSGYGLDGALPRIVLCLDEQQAAENDTRRGQMAQLLQPPPEFHGCPLTTERLLVAEVAA